jgi:FkbM family methyltransferase
MRQMNNNALRETSKLSLRRALQRANLSIGREPMTLRLARAIDSLSIDAVLDVGANVGQFAALLRSAGFSGRIVSFEPLPEAFDALSWRASRDSYWEARQIAVGEPDGTPTIHVSRNSYSSSLLAVNETQVTAAPDSIVVQDVRLGCWPTTVAHAGSIRLGGTASVSPSNHSQGSPPTSTTGRNGRSSRSTRTATRARSSDGAGDLVEELTAMQLEMSFVPL